MMLAMCSSYDARTLHFIVFHYPATHLVVVLCVQGQHGDTQAAHGTLHYVNALVVVHNVHTVYSTGTHLVVMLCAQGQHGGMQAAQLIKHTQKEL